MRGVGRVRYKDLTRCERMDVVESFVTGGEGSLRMNSRSKVVNIVEETLQKGLKDSDPIHMKGP